ncbi:hypothetical protein ACFYO9_34200 [Streptomyces sp. NPDC005863]|uniref:hypothetical protein n=1 Tax=Streptomyces sp. NPDC005863 TaxID=3364735 RepID=UPI00368010A5
MAITPKPITEHTQRLEDRSPIGTRYTDGRGGVYTLVAYDIDPDRRAIAEPVLLGDYQFEISHTLYDVLDHGSVRLEYANEIVEGEQTLDVAPADPEMSERARAAAMKRYQEPARDTGDLWSVLVFEDLDTDDKVTAFHKWAKAELELRKAEAELARAAQERAWTLERLIGLTGSQQKAGRTVGLNQSSISRALRTLPADRP